jgi:hypothetical protein
MVLMRSNEIMAGVYMFAEGRADETVRLALAARPRT